jgi:hypothetical protein
MSRLSSSLDQLSDYVEANVSAFSDGNNQIIALTEAGLDISEDFSDPEGTQNLKSAILDLLAELLENKTSLENLIGTTRGLPRMTTEFNRAKKRAVKAEERMLGEIERLRGSLSATLASFETDGTV